MDRGTATLMYHDVTAEPASSGFRRPGATRFKVSLAAFTAHLRALTEAGCTPQLVSQCWFPPIGRQLLLTFDDGGASAVSAAAELERHGWRAHFFIVTSLVGAAGFLTAREILALRRAGHVIGSHSVTHPDIFADLPRQRMLDEWRRSRDTLGDILGEDCLAASVPGGELSPLVVQTAAEAGYHYLFTSEPLLQPSRHNDCWVVGRVAIRSRTSASRVRSLAQLQGWQRALFVRRLRNAARRAVPALHRWYVNRTTRAVSGTVPGALR